MSGERALVVDDEAEVVALCSRLLHKAGFEVSSAESAEQALQLLESHPFDLLLVDLRLPGSDGFGLIRQARALQPDMAVVIMTGYGTVETAVRALEEGAAGLVLKPFESNEAMLRQVQQALESSRARRDAARSRALQPLFDLTETLFSETEESNLASRVVNAVRAQMDSQTAQLFLCEEAKPEQRLLASAGEILEGSAGGKETPAGMAAERLAIIHWSLDEPGLAAAAWRWLADRRLAAVVCVPVRRAQGAYLVLATRQHGRPPFGESEQELLLLLARQAAVALENARLYGALRAYVREVERSQQRLVQTEKLAAIGRLTASIAHEVNNPLQSLRNCLDLAGREDLEESKRKDYLRLANEELDRLDWIVRQMLEFYRPEAATRKLVDPNRVLNDVALLTAAQCRSKGISVSLELAEKLPPVWGVAFQLQQVALNLVLNAIDAMPEGGSLLLQTEAAAGRVVMIFRDTGRGISHEERQHIFEPFYTSKAGGTGLGLAISYGIVSAHAGSIQVESDPGVGSIFRVALPVAEQGGL
jgi:signal transduction histidine kinase/CheY-like chemotaxis protein